MVTRMRMALVDAAREPDRARRALLVAAAVAGALERAGCSAVLVGGAAVEIYTRSAYTTFDLDFVAAHSPALERTMRGLGFERHGRHWVERDLQVVVEFPGTVLAPALEVTMDVDGTTLRIIAIEDLIVDRLAGWKHWGWEPDGAAAALLLALHRGLDRRRLQRRARAEEVLDALEALRPLAERGDKLEAGVLRALRANLGREKR